MFVFCCKWSFAWLTGWDKIPFYDRFEGPSFLPSFRRLISDQIESTFFVLLSFPFLSFLFLFPFCFYFCFCFLSVSFLFLFYVSFPFCFYFLFPFLSFSVSVSIPFCSDVVQHLGWFDKRDSSSTLDVLSYVLPYSRFKDVF